jgi:hypothetical protein
MDGRLWTLVSVLLALVVLLVLLTVLLGLERRRARRERAELWTELGRLRSEVDEQAAAVRQPADVEYVITRVGEPDQLPARRSVSDQVVLSAAFGEPLLKVLAVGHGLRRALSPQSRNRIGFEVRREMKRARKVRRREMRTRRWTRTDQVAQQGADGPGRQPREDVA